MSLSFELRKCSFPIPRLAAACAFLRRPSAAADGARVVKYGKEDVVPVHAKLRFSTLIVLPENEEILDFTTGDREFWIINGAHNLCYVHPAQAGIRSNLNLITASGHVYSFLLTEISNEPNVEPDLKLFVEPKEGSGSADGLHGYVRAPTPRPTRRKWKPFARRPRTSSRGRGPCHRRDQPVPLDLRDANSASITRSTPRLAANRFSFPPSTTTTRSPTSACAAREKPALYEMKDGKPNLISFQVENGVYIAPKILDNGYLAVGKKKLNFTRAVAAK